MKLDLDELERLDKAATPGPWRIMEILNDPNKYVDDKYFVQKLRNAAPELIRLARIGQYAELDRIKSRLTEIHGLHAWPPPGDVVDDETE